jgi:predicted ABC-type ATPase
LPTLYIITGANGAGKSTVGFSYLPKRVQGRYEIFDGDKLFMRKHRELYLHQKISLKEARNIATEWLYGYFDTLVNDALKEHQPFIYEGHLPEEENWSTPKRFKQAGYKIHVMYFGLQNINLAELRVMDRAKHGGHNVPIYEIERNYYGNLKMLNSHYELINDLKIIDTSESTRPKLLAHFKNSKIVSSVNYVELPEWFQSGLPALCKIIIEEEGL